MKPEEEKNIEAQIGQVPEDSEAPKSSKTKTDPKKEALEWIKDIGCALLTAFIVLQLVMPTIVRQTSMQNTLQEGDYVFVSKKAYKWFGSPERGDIIVFQSTLPLSNGSGDKLLVKRIIAVGGDRIAVSEGKVYLNGAELSEDYLKDGTTSGNVAETVIPEGYLFCMGDNRLGSTDSRDERVGLVSEADVVGKVVLRLFPLNKFGSVYE